MSSAIPGSAAARPEETRLWRIWSFLKSELLYFSWAIMDVALLAPVALTVMRWGRYWPPALVTLWLLLLILLPFNLVRAMSALQIPARTQGRVMAAALIITLLITWRGLLYAPRPPADLSWLGEFFGRVGESGDPQWARDLTVFVFVLVAWWRGLRLAQLTPDINRVGLRLRAGGLLLAPIAFFLHVRDGSWSVTPFVLLYFLAGLAAVALIRAEQIERDRSGFAASLSPGWVAAIMATALLIVAGAGTFAAILGGEPAALLSGWLAPLWFALSALGTVAVSTLVYLLTPGLNLLTVLFGWLAEALGAFFSGLDVRFALDSLSDGNGLQMFDITPPEEAASLFALPAPLSRGLILGAMLLLAIIISLLLTRYFRQVQQAPRDSARLESASTAPDSTPPLVDRLLGRLGFRRWRTAASIRNIYSAMCEAAAAVGYPRATAQTPYEYHRTLAEVWPGNTADSKLITEAFIRVRYGQVPESSAEVLLIKEAWGRLSTTPPTAVAERPQVSTLPDA